MDWFASFCMDAVQLVCGLIILLCICGVIRDIKNNSEDVRIWIGGAWFLCDRPNSNNSG